MRNVLIIGKNSYIGRNVYNWLSNFPETYSFNLISVRDDGWKYLDFSKYDTVINFAGLAHINDVTSDMKELFYSVNRDLVIELGKKSKEQGVKHFIHFSSMNVYGDYCNNISDRTAVNPTSFYGDSKLQGDLGLEKLEDDNFVVAYIRPPFVYGKGCSGNYNSISKIAKKTPFFPDFKNRKSMIYIDNLCEFIKIVIDKQIGGVLTPQNKELVSTSELVRQIANVSGKKVVFTKIFNWALPIGNKLTRQIRRAFADDCYVRDLSDYFGWSYCVVDFWESIRRTEET